MLLPSGLQLKSTGLAGTVDPLEGTILDAGCSIGPTFGARTPRVDPTALVAETAYVMGDVGIGERCRCPWRRNDRAPPGWAGGPRRRTPLRSVR